MSIRPISRERRAAMIGQLELLPTDSSHPATLRGSESHLPAQPSVDHTPEPSHLTPARRAATWTTE